MKKLTFLFSILFITLLSFVNLFAQESIKDDAASRSNETYKIYTYTIVGSNNPTGSKKIPGEVSNALADIKKDFAYKDYQLLSTQFQLIKEGGDVLYRSVLNDLDIPAEKNYAIFGNWSFQGLTENMVNGRKQLGFNTFVFNMRFPIKTFSLKEAVPIVNYEQFGITTRKIDFPIGDSVVFASLPIEISDKTLFFVIRTEKAK